MPSIRRHFARYGEWWWVPVFYALVVMWIYRDLWHQHGAATGFGWDTIDTHGPDLDFLSRDLREGRFSLWNPYDKGGYAVFCDPVFDRYYPFNWPFATWGAIAGSSWWLVQIKVLAHHVAAASCMHLFLRTRGLSVRASLIGAIGLVASTPLLVHKASNVLWPLVWVPLVWVAIDAALAKPSWRRGAGVAAAFTLVATAGSPPGMFYALLLIAPYGVWRVIGVVKTRTRGSASGGAASEDARARGSASGGAASEDARAKRRRLIPCVAVAAVVALLVLAVTVIPAQTLVALGSRDRFATGSDFALALSLPLPAAIRGVITRGAGQFEMYMGAAIVLLAACALVIRPRFDRGAAVTMTVIAGFGVILAAGATALLLTFLVAHVPVFALLRVPGRYKLLTAWSLAAAAGYGAAALETCDPRLRRRVIACAASGVAIAIVLVAIWGHSEAKDRSAWWSVVAMIAAAACVIAAVRAPPKWANFAFGGLAMCALLDAPTLTFTSAAPPAADVRQTHDRDDAIAARLEGASDRWRIYDEFVLGERAGARLRLRDFRGYPALDPISLHRYVDVLDFAKKNPEIITDFNVRWLLVHPHFRYATTASFVKMPHAGFVDRGGSLWEASHPAPLVTWVGAITVVADPHAVLAAVRAIEEPDGSRRSAIVEPDAALATSGEPDSRDGTIESYEPNEIRFTIDAPHDGLVVLNEIMFPGWEVEVDGAPATPLRANYLLRAVWVGAGHHVVTWRFEPAHWRVLVAGYLLAIAIMLAAAVAPRRRSA